MRVRCNVKTFLQYKLKKEHRVTRKKNKKGIEWKMTPNGCAYVADDDDDDDDPIRTHLYKGRQSSLRKKKRVVHHKLICLI